jgi:CheY-like chemotaxis protein
VISNLKDFARPWVDHQLKPVKIKEVIDKVMTIVGAQARKAVAELELYIEDDLPIIHGHSQKISQIVTNLVINATQAIARKELGKLVISSRYIERLGAVIIQVEDNGKGMEPGIVERLFEPFFTTRREAGGTGLGLSISYGLIKEHQGMIGVLTRIGLGSRFTVFLPIDLNKPLEIRPLILCVGQDTEFLQWIHSYLLEIQNISIEITTRLNHVMFFLEQHPEVDIVMMDLSVSNPGEWELLCRIKKRFPLVSVILYANNPDILSQKPDDIPPPDHLLRKPFMMDQLMSTIYSLERQRL